MSLNIRCAYGNGRFQEVTCFAAGRSKRTDRMSRELTSAPFFGPAPAITPVPLGSPPGPARSRTRSRAAQPHVRPSLVLLLHGRGLSIEGCHQGTHNRGVRCHEGTHNRGSGATREPRQVPPGNPSNEFRVMGYTSVSMLLPYLSAHRFYGRTIPFRCTRSAWRPVVRQTIAGRTVCCI